MGCVSCPKHGMQTGLMTCAHVRSAIGTGSAPLPLIEHGIVEIYFLEEGPPVKTALCKPCLQRYDLSPGMRVSVDVWEDTAKFPATAPDCPKCFKLWIAGAS